MVNIQTKIRRALKKDFQDWDYGSSENWWLSFFGEIEYEGIVKRGFVGIRMSDNLKDNELQMRHGDNWVYYPFDNCEITLRESKRFIKFTRNKEDSTVEIVINYVENEE